MAAVAVEVTGELLMSGDLLGRIAELEAQIAESPVTRRNAVRAAVDAERARIVARIRELARPVESEVMRLVAAVVEGEGNRP